MTKTEFKKLWESNDNGGGVTYDDIAECAKAWGIASHPKTMQINNVLYRVLKTAETNDAEDYAPKEKELTS
jgi:hypothetical protein